MKKLTNEPKMANEPTEKPPIIDIRGNSFSWFEEIDGEAVKLHRWSIEVRRQGEDKWAEIPVIERKGP